MAVDDAHLAVVAVVHLAGEGRELHRHEGVNLHAGVAHALIEIGLHLPVSHVVVDNPYLHAPAGMAYQGIGNEVAQGVVVEDVAVDVDVVARAGHVAQEGMKEGVAVGEDVHLVVLEGHGTVLLHKQTEKRAVFLGHLQVGLLLIFKHGALGQLVERLLGDEALLARVLPEEEIKDDSHHRHKKKHHHPRHGLGRLAVVEQHAGHGADNGQHIDGDDEPVDVNHLNPASLWVCNDNRHLGWLLMYSTQSITRRRFSSGSPVSQGCRK